MNNKNDEPEEEHVSPIETTVKTSPLGITNGTEIIETKEFSEGLAAFCGDDGRWGFVDENLNIVIEPVYSSVTPFYHGVSVVGLYDSWRVIDKTGKDVPSKWIKHGDDHETRYEGIGKIVNHVTETDRDPDREYWTERFIFDTGENIWLCDGVSSYSGSSTDDWNKGYISIPKKK